MGAIDWVERRTGQALLGAMFMKLGFDAARSPGPRVEKAAALGLSKPELAVRGNGAAMVLGRAALRHEELPGPAALGLMAPMMPTTRSGHPFCDLESALRKDPAIH